MGKGGDRSLGGEGEVDHRGQDEGNMQPVPAEVAAGAGTRGGGRNALSPTTDNRDPQRRGRGGRATAAEGNGSDRPEGEPQGGRVRGGTVETQAGCSWLCASQGGNRECLTYGVCTWCPIQGLF